MRRLSLYKEDRYGMSFQISKITGHSDHPLRDSNDRLIFGSHTLWDHAAIANENDGRIDPQVFPHDFDSAVSSDSPLHITIKLLDNVVGGEYRLHGKLDNFVVFESEVVAVGSLEPITITVNIVQPKHSNVPFSWIGLFSWELKHNSTLGDKVHHATPRTHLELYWIKRTVDEIFLGGRAGIPIGMLRQLLPSLTSDGLIKLQNMPRATMQAATLAAYGYFTKVYDSYLGTPHFGVSYWGGVFQYSYYVAAAATPGSPPGSLQRFVNCYDQAAMVQILASSSVDRPSWLFMKPFGYINQCNLVGIGPCNNPFFSTNGTQPVIDINDPHRTGFINHVFNGAFTTYDQNRDSIYDGCSLLGYNLELTPPQTYINSAVDSITTLTAVPRGVLANISQTPGVTGVTAATRMYDMVEPSKGLDQVIDRSATKIPHAKSLSQIHWDNLSEWIKYVIGNKAEVGFHEVRFFNGAVEALWHLIGIDYGKEDDSLVFRVRVHTWIDSDGKLDYTESSNAALDDLRFNLKNTDMDLEKDDEALNRIWEASELTDYAQHAIQTKSSFDQSRILVVSGNSLIDIGAGNPTTVIEPFVREVLSYTTTDKPVSLDIPYVSHHIHLPPVKKGRDNIARGINTVFEIICTVSGLVSKAMAHVDDHGLLFEDVEIYKDTVRISSTVRFIFRTRTIGLHEVVVVFAFAPALVVTSEELEVEVIE